MLRSSDHGSQVQGECTHLQKACSMVYGQEEFIRSRAPVSAQAAECAKQDWRDIPMLTTFHGQGKLTHTAVADVSNYNCN